MKQKEIPVILLVLVMVSFFACKKPDYQNNNQDKTQPRAAITGIKYNPGHYWMIYKNRRSDTKYLNDVLRELDENPALKGIQVKFQWRELEERMGIYKFEVIDALLASLTSHHKQLVILIELKSFHSSDPETLVPDYVRTNPVYEGGLQKYMAYPEKDDEGNFIIPPEPKGHVIKIWNPYVFKRFCALLERLGRRYNDKANFEGIGLSESTFYCWPDWLNKINGDPFFDKLMMINQNLKEYFPNSLTYQFVNYPQNQLRKQATALQRMASGWAGPDVFPTDGGLNGEGKAYWWYEQLSGKIPLLPSVQTEDYLWTTHNKKKDPGHKPTITELFEFARDDLKANYIFWERAYKDGVNYYAQVLTKLNEPAIRKASAGGLNADCPDTYKLRGRCITN